MSSGQHFETAALDRFPPALPFIQHHEAYQYTDNEVGGT